MCGNDRIDFVNSEECDGNLFFVDGAEVVDAMCEDLGLPVGALACDSYCRLDTSACTGPGCGNGLVEEGEACDEGPNPRTRCFNYGYPCVLCVACQEVESFRGCGDGVVEEDYGEECDGDAPLDCASLGWGAGEATCMDDCDADVSACEGPVCGDGFVTGEELCDPEALAQYASDACVDATTGFNQLVAGCGEGQYFSVFGNATCASECGEWDLSTCLVAAGGPFDDGVPYGEFIEDCLGALPGADTGSDLPDAGDTEDDGSTLSPGTDASDAPPGSTADDERAVRNASGCSSAGALPTAWWALGLFALVGVRRVRRASP